MSRWLGGRGWCAASGRSFALTRQGVRLLHRFVNCGPAQCCVPPVVAPAEGIVRAGAGRRGGAFLLECSALGSRPPCGSNRGVLRSVHACRAVLLECSALDHARRAVLLECPALDHACRAVLLECLAFGSRLSLFLCQEKRDGLRDVAFLFRRESESPLVRSHDFARLSDFAGSLRICPFLYGDSDGVPEEVQEAIGKPPGERTSLEQKSYPCAVTRNAGCRAPQSSCKPIVFLWRSDCAFAATPRGVRWGSAPQTCAKESSTLWTLFIWVAAWVRLARRGRSRTTKAYLLFPRPAALGYTERLARVRFMLGQVGLYSDDTYKLKRPDSSRPAAAAKSRVDTREAERPPALPAYFSIAALRLVISRMIFGSNFARRS